MEEIILSLFFFFSNGGGSTHLLFLCSFLFVYYPDNIILSFFALFVSFVSFLALICLPFHFLLFELAKVQKSLIQYISNKGCIVPSISQSHLLLYKQVCLDEYAF